MADDIKSRCDLEKFFLERGEIFLYGSIDDNLTYNVATELKYLLHKKFTNVKIFINSDGGGVDCCCTILDVMEQLKAAKCTVNTIAEGCCYSSAAFILAMGSKGYRYATPNTNIMLHHPTIIAAEDTELNRKTKEITAANKQIESILELVGRAAGKTTKKTIQKFKDDVGKDLWLDVDEAIKYKIIDGIYPANI